MEETSIQPEVPKMLQGWGGSLVNVKKERHKDSKISRVYNGKCVYIYNIFKIDNCEKKLESVLQFNTHTHL